MSVAIISPVSLGPDIVVSALGLGCMALTDFYGADTDGASAPTVIRAALDAGINFLDTADAYGPFRNEIAVGEAIRGVRDQIVLSTKFGVRREPGSSVMSERVDGRPAYVKEACEASLQRLGVDHIDLYFMHRPDPTVPIEETAGALKELVEAGKVRAIGFCEIGASLLRRAHAVHPVAALQSEYSLWHRDPQELFGVLKELDVGLVAYSPLGRGFLSGRFRSIDDLAPDDWRRLSPRFQGENFRRNLAIVDGLQAFAGRRGCTTAQLALAWIRATFPSAVALTGATTAAQLAENVASLALAMTEAELSEIESYISGAAFTGAAWPAGSLGEKVDRS